MSLTGLSLLLVFNSLLSTIGSWCVGIISGRWHITIITPYRQGPRQVSHFALNDVGQNKLKIHIISDFGHEKITDYLKSTASRGEDLVPCYIRGSRRAE